MKCEVSCLLLLSATAYVSIDFKGGATNLRISLRSHNGFTLYEPSRFFIFEMQS